MNENLSGLPKMNIIIKKLKTLVRKNKYLEIMIYIVQNSLAKYLNFSGDTLNLNINEKIDYSYKVFNSYKELIGKPDSFLKSKSILDIGAGNNFLIALHLLSKGANKVVSIDRFNCLDPDRFNSKLYQKFLNNLNQKEKDILLKKVIFKKNKIVFLDNCFKYYSGFPLEEAGTVLNEKFDIILSNAVLEHTSNLDKCFKTMKNISKINTLLVHIVDLRNHLRFQSIHPLYFLTFSDSLWNLMSSNLGSPNRERYNFYEQLFKKYNLKILNIIKSKFEYDDKFLLPIKPKLNKKFKFLDDEVLRINIFKVLLKNETN